MAAYPSGLIIFINKEITYPKPPPYFPGTTNTSELGTLQTQLSINDTISKQEFDARIATDPNYPKIIHLFGWRVLVILNSFQDKWNRELADVVMFIHQGLADVEHNKFGPPHQSFDIQRITFYQLYQASKNHDECFDFSDGDCEDGLCDNCFFPLICDRCHTFSGLRKCIKCDCECRCGCEGRLTDNLGYPINPIYLNNCDSELHHRSFRERK